MSFREETTFSMIASEERRHARRVFRHRRLRTRFLPVAAIYGGNASGKTNFFKALNFVKQFVVRGRLPNDPISVEPFRLDAGSSGQPTFFCFELLIGEQIYVFSFSVTAERVLEEKLTRVESNSKEVPLYERRADDVTFGGASETSDFHRFLAQSTRGNQLFLTSSVNLNFPDFQPVYEWFRDTLELVGPDTRFAPFGRFMDEEDPRYKEMNALLARLDTGVIRLGGKESRIEDLPIFAGDIQEGMTVQISMGGPKNRRYVVSRKNGQLITKQLVTYHAGEDGTEIPFDPHQESDGTLRVIDLLPAFVELSSPDARKVYVVDEIDRSLHTLLTRGLLENYLNSCLSNAKKQLLFTTHDVLLMDPELFRRDEMWICDRQLSGETTLIALSEFKEALTDRDLRGSYLRGRMGGIPRLLLDGLLG